MTSKTEQHNPLGVRHHYKIVTIRRDDVWKNSEDRELIQSLEEGWQVLRCDSSNQVFVYVLQIQALT